MALQTLKAQAATDRQILYATGLPWIDAAVFTPAVGDPITLNVVHDINNLLQPEPYETRTAGTQNRVKALISDLTVEPVGRNSNRAGDIFTINSIDYEVSTVEERDNHSITCLVREL